MAHIEATRAAAAVHPWHKVALTAALLPAAPGLLMLREGMELPVFLGVALLAALPLACRESGRRFAAACVVAGTALLVVGVLGLYLGLYIFLPSALLLPLAAFADPRRRRVTASFLTGLATLLATVAALLFGCMAVAMLTD
ncbi:hypothetical protein ACWGDE_21890 [Streptomyces sp. NPDC054956]